MRLRWFALLLVSTPIAAQSPVRLTPTDRTAALQAISAQFTAQYVFP